MKVLTRLRALIEEIRRTPSISLQRMDYDTYWRARGHSGMRPRYEVFASLIEHGATVLDIGCGDGGALDYLSKTRSIQGLGLDISEVAVSMARARGLEADVADVTAPDFSLEKTYDYIIMSEIIEHIAEPEHLLKAIQGRYHKALILSVPNIGYYRHRLRMMSGRFPVQWAQHPAEHLRFWTVIDFLFWLESLGYEATRVIASNGLNPFLARHWPNLFGNQIVYEVRRAP